MAVSVDIHHVAANRTRHLIFFPNDGLVYNYKTSQWARVPAYQNFPMYSVNCKFGIIGLARADDDDNVEVALQGVDTIQDAVLETGAFEVEEGTRSIINGIRPIHRGGEVTLQVGTQDFVDDTVDWSFEEKPESRTGKAYFRSEGRYLRVRMNAENFDVLIGIDVDGKPTSKT